MNQQLQETRDACRQLREDASQFQEAWEGALRENERITADLRRFTGSQVSKIEIKHNNCHSSCQTL